MSDGLHQPLPSTQTAAGLFRCSAVSAASWISVLYSQNHLHQHCKPGICSAGSARLLVRV